MKDTRLLAVYRVYTSLRWKKDNFLIKLCYRVYTTNEGVSMAEQGKVITFRVSEEELLELERNAGKGQVTIQQFAKRALLERLTADAGNVALSVSALKEELLELRQDLAVSVEALLVTAGKVPPEDALKFVSEKLKKRI